MSELSYKEAGVSIEAGELATAKIKRYAEGTHNRNVLKGIGLFSGFYELEAEKYQQPVLVSSIDGVGTKVKVAEMAGSYGSIGQDLVNHCVNDIAVCGADPLFFLDYVAADKLDVEVIQALVQGMSFACRQANCALIGGETAEMPGVYRPHNFDVAGAVVGIVSKSQIIDGSRIGAGDVLVGLASNGLHTNGYSLARRVFFELKHYGVDDCLPELGSTLGEALLQPHKSYLHLIRTIRTSDGVHGIAHITGGGIIGNASRLLRQGLALSIDWSTWQPPAIFELLQKAGGIEETEMRRVFNVGIGLVLIVAEKDVDRITRVCGSCGERSLIIGSIISK
ncbi:MAG: phosphoribosylformylglycinamidine cyclo-ligase [bacterium]